MHVLPSRIDLVGASLELVDVPQREHVLRKILAPIRDGFDFVIIDCPPELGLLTLNSLTAADAVLIPVQCEYLALEGLGKLLNTINLVRTHLNPQLDIEGVLLTLYDSRLRLSKQVAEEVRSYFGEKVYRSVIHRNVRLSEAPSFGKPVILYDALSVGSQNYIDLAQEVLKNAGLPPAAPGSSAAAGLLHSRDLPPMEAAPDGTATDPDIPATED
jgi:chromosome partitioning protein